MTEFKRISAQDAHTLINNGDITLADIRDQHAYHSGHIHNATHLDNSNIDQFIASSAKDKPLIVYCYHGNSSQNAAQFFLEQGFVEVYSMDGGFEQWQNLYLKA